MCNWQYITFGLKSLCSPIHCAWRLEIRLEVIQDIFFSCLDRLLLNSVFEYLKGKLPFQKFWVLNQRAKNSSMKWNAFSQTWEGQCVMCTRICSQVLQHKLVYEIYSTLNPDHASLNRSDGYRGHAFFLGTERYTGSAIFARNDRYGCHAPFTRTDMYRTWTIFTRTHKKGDHTIFTGPGRHRGHTSFLGMDRYRSCLFPWDRQV